MLRNLLGWLLIRLVDPVLYPFTRLGEALALFLEWLR